MNLININACQTGWIYQPAANGVEKIYADFFGQSNVMTVTPGDVIQITGATPNTDFFFITSHGSVDINNTITSYKVVPIRSENGLSVSNFTVPTGVFYISVAFINTLLPKLDVRVVQHRPKSAIVSCLGDSITQGFIAPGVWASPNYPEIVANKLGCVVNNYGLCATGICEGSAESFASRIDRMTEEWVDCLVIFGGTNDYGDRLATMMGSIHDAPAKGRAFYAAYKYLIEKAMNRYPMAQILVVTPIRRANNGRNGNGIGLEDIAQAEKDVARMYGVRCFDFYHECTISARYLRDGLHPTQQGIELFVGPVIAAEVEPLVKYR